MSSFVPANIRVKAPEFLVPEHEELPVLSESIQHQYRDDIKRALKAQDAVLVAHYYTHPDVQALAEETGGCVADSLEMARFGHQTDAKVLLVAGVRFMGETAKILNPEKTVIVPNMKAQCSLDLGCPIDAFKAFKAAHPNRTVVVYANTSAAVKAQADWVVTSSIALEVVEHLRDQGEKILWAPDKHLGRYVQRMTGADIVMYPGACVVHDEFKAQGLRHIKHVYPNAAVLAHPESPEAVLELADVVASTTGMVKAAARMDNPIFIVATDRGLFYKLQQVAPDKKFIEAPTAGEGATCRSCAHCPWMAMNHLQSLKKVLAGDYQGHEITVDSLIVQQAKVPLERMMAFAQSLQLTVKGNA